MIHNCSRCGRDFLTEANDSIQKYEPNENGALVRNLYCNCEITQLQAALKVARETLSRIKATNHTELCNYISTIRKCDCHVGDAIVAIAEIENLIGLENR